jgi:hypothetical protein
MLDAEVRAMAAQMQTREAREGRKRALQTRPKLRIEPDPETD